MTHDSLNRTSPRSFAGLWRSIPLYQRILGGVVLGAILGFALGAAPKLFPAEWNITPAMLVLPLEIPGKLVLRLLGALAAPLVLTAVVHALMHAHLPPGSASKLVFLLLLNTLVAISIGLAVANTLKPGKWNAPEAAPEQVEGASKKPHSAPNPATQFLENVPKSLLGPLGDDGKVLSVIIIAVAFGIALRGRKMQPLNTPADFVECAFQTLLTMLHWILEIIPAAVMGIVASIIAVKGLAGFQALGGFVVAVIVALVLQTAYYLLRIRMGSWVHPWAAISGVRDALVMAFSTASSTATMPLTYKCLREKVGLRERSASLGSLVGANFNNDGTALYEAMAALFISQMIGHELSFVDQILIVLTSVVASVGAAGIPEAGIVTMTLVFTAVRLDTSYIPLLLTVDWFLDRCRTTVNVLGDVNVSCLLDGPTPETQAVPLPESPLAAEPNVPESVIAEGASHESPPTAQNRSDSAG